MKENSGESLVNLNVVCKKVLDIDDKIRFVGIINEKGKLIAGGLRNGLKSLEDPKDDEMLFMELALRVKMRQEFDKQLGPVKFSLSMREKVLVMSFPLTNSQVLYVSADRTINFESAAMRTLEIIK